MENLDYIDMALRNGGASSMRSRKRGTLRNAERGSVTECMDRL